MAEPEGGNGAAEAVEADEPDVEQRPTKKKAARKIDAPKREEANAPAEPASTATRLATWGRTRVEVSTSPQPWRERYDALVLPASPGPRPELAGELATSFREALGPDHWERFVGGLYERLQDRALTPEQPVLVALPDAPGVTVRQVVVATAIRDRQGKPTAEAARVAAAAALALAAESGAAHVGLPILGSGHGGLPAAATAIAILDAVHRARAVAELDRVTLLSLDPAVVDALIRVETTHSQPVANDLAEGDDLLHVEAEAFALADTLLLRDTHPPLVAGIFGGWGSGKSFVMHLMRKRMARIRALPIDPARRWPPKDAPASPFVGHVYMIPFDAWTYAKADLWSSLMQTIFSELDRQLTIEKRLGTSDGNAELWLGLAEMSEGQGEALLNDPAFADAVKAAGNAATTEALWKALREQREAAITELRAKEVDLAEQRAELEKRREAFRLEAVQAVQEQARDEAKAALASQLGNSLKALAADVRKRLDLEANLPAGTDAPPLSVSAGAAWETFRANPEPFLVGLGVFALACATPYLVPRLADYGAEWITGSGLMGGLGLLGSVVRTYTRARELADRAYRSVQTRVEHDVAARGSQIDKALEAKIAASRKDPKANEFGGLERDIAGLEANVEGLRHKAGLAGSFVSLADFVSSRAADGTYEKGLGLVHRVQRDLRELSEALHVHPGEANAEKKQELFRRGPPRIVLFIDDLDRCPPDKVVEVLEAVQLLVKTPLFVVVLAMDERFVTRALEKRYEGVLARDGDPSGLDYIEKIVQIPYRVRDIGDDALHGFLEAQMAIQRARPMTQPTATSPAASTVTTPAGSAPAAGPSGESAPELLPHQVIEFDKNQLALVERCCKAIDLSPRAVKRLVNVYKLLKIIWFRKSGAPDAEVEHVVILLLALSARFPEPMREVLRALGDAIETARAEKREAVRPTFARFFASLPAPAVHADPGRAWPRLLQAAKALAPTLPLDALPRDTFDLVLSFSFVGDVGYESLAPIRIALVDPDGRAVSAPPS